MQIPDSARRLPPVLQMAYGSLPTITSITVSGGTWETLATLMKGTFPIESLADTECSKDPVQNVVGRRRSRDSVDRSQRRVEIQQHHLMRDACSHRFASLFQIPR